MLSLIIANLSTIIVGLIVLAIVAAVVIKLVRDKINHKSSCGCGCAAARALESAGASQIVNRIISRCAGEKLPRKFRYRQEFFANS